MPVVPPPRFRPLFTAALALAILATAPLRSPAAGLESRLAPLVAEHQGQVAVAVKHLTTGEEYLHRADAPMPTASLIKLPIMVAAYRQLQAGRVQPDQLVTLTDADKVPGSGILTRHISPGTKLTLRDLIRLMIAHSDNTATNLVLDQIDLATTNETLETLGFRATRLNSKVYHGGTSLAPARSKEFGLGSTTAGEMIRLLEMLHHGQLADAATTQTMLEHLLHCEDGTMLAASLPSGVRLAHKSGAVNNARCDAGLLLTSQGPIAICVLTNRNQDQRWSADNAAQRLCAQVAAAVCQHFAPEPSSTDRLILRSGDGGRWVETLQRTLNERLQPSPELAVDGDFGPATRAAVVQFQKSRQLAANGIVGAETWKALSPILTLDPVAPEPEVVNAAVLPQKPAESLTGPPLVTCKAWAIGDATTGEVLHHAAADQPLEPASTTKIMTAHVILQAAAKNPQLLAQTVTFSPRADNTPGSTAGLRAGESVTVEQLLYGLMLPSGNDAATALAEHLGAQLLASDNRPEKSADSQATDPLRRFVAEMNRTAAQLKLEKTRYENPHGLTATGHLTTARDLVRLATTAMRDERFAQVVATRQYGVKVHGPLGTQRNIVWKNTNQLLEMAGYLGVKTGTTDTAGACLVSIGAHANHRHCVVVLGATSPEARYTDSRNLYRWAWGSRGQGSGVRDQGSGRNEQ